MKEKCESLYDFFCRLREFKTWGHANLYITRIMWISIAAVISLFCFIFKFVCQRCFFFPCLLPDFNHRAALFIHRTGQWAVNLHNFSSFFWRRKVFNILNIVDLLFVFDVAFRNWHFGIQNQFCNGPDDESTHKSITNQWIFVVFFRGFFCNHITLIGGDASDADYDIEGLIWCL